MDQNNGGVLSDAINGEESFDVHLVPEDMLAAAAAVVDITPTDIKVESYGGLLGDSRTRQQSRRKEGSQFSKTHF